MNRRQLLSIVSALTLVLIYGCGEAAAPKSVRDCDVCPEMVMIPAGSFMMGSPASEKERADSEGPQYKVNIRPFAAGKFEVTFDEWDACVRERGCTHNPDYRDRGKRPVMDVSWNDAKEYTKWLSAKTGKPYRLLSEAEWEYVARAGTTAPFNTGANINPTQATYDARKSYAGSVTGDRVDSTAAVGSFKPNAFGLYDVHGNVLEWTEDCLNPNYLGAPNDGSARTSGDCGRRAVRGGSWDDSPQRLRSAFRMWYSVAARGGILGLRVARTQ
jgi:formylglycine-generating enzyme required for sulfatase activity